MGHHGLIELDDVKPSSYLRGMLDGLIVALLLVLAIVWALR